MKSIAWLTLVAGASGAVSCATTNTQPTHAERVVVVTDEGSIRAPEEREIVSVKAKAKPATVLPILRDSYEEVGIKVEIFEPAGAAGGQVGNRYFVKTYRLGKNPLGYYLDCGNTVIGAAADNYKITMSVLSIVAPDSAGSSINTRVSARADPAAGGSGSLSCRSIGTLEAEIHRVLIRRLGE